jgi:subtilase family serine protease
VYDDYLFTSDEAGVFCYNMKGFCPGYLYLYTFPPPPVDLRVKRLQAAWDSKQTCVQIAATIRNDGGSDAPAFRVLFQAGGESTARYMTGLAAHTDLDLTVVIPLTAAPPVEVKVTVDYLNEVAEANEANNLAVFTLY